MRKGLKPDDLGDLLELPILAVLATYRRNGTVLLRRFGTSGAITVSTS
jgi:hypothetical protein